VFTTTCVTCITKSGWTKLVFIPSSGVGHHMRSVGEGQGQGQYLYLDINFDHHKCQQECCRLNKVSLDTWQLCWSPHASGRACWRKPACISHPSPNNSESDEVNNLNLAESGIAGLAVFRTSGSTYLSKFNPSSSCYGLLNPLTA
jgi:hypothetical protein